MSFRHYLSILFLCLSVSVFAQNPTKINAPEQIRQSSDSLDIFVTDENGKPRYTPIIEQSSKDSDNIIEADATGRLKVRPNECVTEYFTDFVGDKITVTNMTLNANPEHIDVWQGGNNLTFPIDYTINNTTNQIVLVNEVPAGQGQVFKVRSCDTYLIGSSADNDSNPANEIQELTYDPINEEIQLQGSTPVDVNEFPFQRADASTVQTLDLRYYKAVSLSVKIVTTDASSYSVDWGDGSAIQTYNSGATASHSFSSTPSGVATINMVSNISKLRDLTVTGKWNFNISEISSLSNLQKFVCENDNIVHGDVGDLPRGLITMDIKGNTTVYGSIGDLPQGLNWCRATGFNTITGDIQDLPQSVTYVGLTGLNEIYGDAFRRYPANCVHYDIQGQNTMSGDLSDLPQNGISGSLVISGQSTITGDIANIPEGIDLITLAGQNTCFGDIAGLPSTMNRMVMTGNNTITGDWANLQSTICNYFIIWGQSTIGGDIAAIANNTYYFDVRTNNSTMTYSNSSSWSNNMQNFVYRGAAGTLTTSQVDSILDDFSALTNWSGVRKVELITSNQPRSAASDNAVNTLQAKGVNVLTN